MHIRDRLRRWAHRNLPLTWPLGARIGLSVTTERIGAVMLLGSVVEWSVVETVGPEETLATAITRVLQRVRARPPWLRPGVWVAIDTPHAQVKTVRGLPPVTDARVIAQLIAATPERFFLGHTSGLVTTGVRVTAPGIAEAAAFETAILDTIQEACTAVGLQTMLFVPATVAIAARPHVDEHRRISEILAAAYGATHVERSEPRIVRRGRRETSSSPERRRRLIVAGVAAAVTAGLAVATPVGLAFRTSRMARRTIAALAPARASTLSTERELTRMTDAINTVEAFEQHRISKTVLVSQLTQALPTAATITVLTIDTTGTTVVVLAPRAADVVRHIEELPGTAQVEMLGPVTHEFTSPQGSTPPGSATSVEMERVTVRFHSTAEGATARRFLGAMQ